MQGVLRWETPPPIDRRTYRAEHRRSWAIVAYELRSKPGHWAVIDEGGSDIKTLGMRVAGGQGYWKPAGAFRVAHRSLGDVPTLYAVFIGNDGEYAQVAEDARRALIPPDEQAADPPHPPDPAAQL